MSLADFENKKLNGMKPLDSCAACMFGTMTCGTFWCFPSSVGAQLISNPKGDGTYVMTDNYLCFCLRPSPIPCFMCCGVGPCAQRPVMMKQSDTLLIGTGDSQLAGGCCKGFIHNAGDQMIFSSDEHGPKATFKVGYSPFYPPCFKGKEIMEVRPPRGGGPMVTEMAR
jgi:hypothetical protein